MGHNRLPPHGVYESHCWIEPLKTLIRGIFEARRALVGICFGHQIVAEAMGGRVERVQSGWVVGPHEYTFSTGNRMVLNAWHQDQVVEVSPLATPVAHSAACPWAAFRYSDSAFTLQPHPEFDKDYFEGLLKATGPGLPANVRSMAAQRLEAFYNPQDGVELVREFLRDWFERSA